RVAGTGARPTPYASSRPCFPGPLSTFAFERDPRPKNTVETTRRESAEHLSQLLEHSRVSIPEERVLHVKGAPDRTIPRTVLEKNIDLLVIGTVARTGVPGWIMGNTAERLLEQIACSVLAIKPDGFISPVTLE
ncbi:MAG: universal stress protein, partial [Planctomycetota bacterium]